MRQAAACACIMLHMAHGAASELTVKWAQARMSGDSLPPDVLAAQKKTAEGQGRST